MDFTPTTRTQQAVSAAVRAATVDGHPQVSPAHLAGALLDQTDGLTEPLLRAVGADPSAVRADVGKVLAGLPSASGSSVAAPQFDRETARVLQHAQTLATEMGDEYVSTEHLLVGLAAAGGRRRPRCSTRHGATPDALREAFAQGARFGAGHQPPTPRAPTRRWRSTAVDLTERARSGALDPVDRPRHRDPPRRAGALPAHQEQPGADRRARRRQDRDRRGPGAADRRR